MKIWMYSLTKNGKKDGTLFLETLDKNLILETLSKLVDNLDEYHKIKIEILNNNEK